MGDDWRELIRIHNLLIRLRPMPPSSLQLRLDLAQDRGPPIPDTAQQSCDWLELNGDDPAKADEAQVRIDVLKRENWRLYHANPAARLVLPPPDLPPSSRFHCAPAATVEPQQVGSPPKQTEPLNSERRNEERPAAKHAGGRPADHDWRGAAQYVERMIAGPPRTPLPRREDGTPILVRAVDLMFEWLEKNDLAPSDKAVIYRWLRGHPQAWWD